LRAAFRKIRPEETLSFADVSAISRRIHERSHRLRVGDLEDRHPACAVWVLVHELGLIYKRLVGLDDLACDRGKDLTHGLHGLDRSDRLTLTTFPTGGSSTYTTSVNSVCAWSVIPTRTRFPSIFA